MEDKRTFDYTKFVGKEILVRKVKGMVKGKLAQITESSIIVVCGQKTVEIPSKDIQTIEEILKKMQTDEEIAKASASRAQDNTQLSLEEYQMDEQNIAQYELETIQKQIPKNYDQLATAEKLMGKKSDYDFNLYTVNLKARQEAEQVPEPAKQPDAPQAIDRKFEVQTLTKLDGTEEQVLREKILVNCDKFHQQNREQIQPEQPKSQIVFNIQAKKPVQKFSLGFSSQPSAVQEQSKQTTNQKEVTQQQSKQKMEVKVQQSKTAGNQFKFSNGKK